MSTVTAFITRHPVRTYFALASAVSWPGILFVLGPGGIPTTIEHLMTIGPAMYVAMLAGPSVVAVAAVALGNGSTGLATTAPATCGVNGAMGAVVWKDVRSSYGS